MLSSRGRVRTPDPRPAVRHEPAQDPLVQARRDPPAAPARRATELEVPPLSRVGQDRLFERPQAASRQRPRVDLLLRLAGQRHLPHSPARGTLEGIVGAARATPAARGEVHLVQNLLAQRCDPDPHYAAFPERRLIHSLASSRVSSLTGFPTISSNLSTPPSSTTSEIRASR